MSRRLRRDALFYAFASLTYSLSQLALVLVLARISSARVVGEFALTLAITAPVFLCLGLNLRVAQATDAVRSWHLHEYLRLRQIFSLVAGILSMFIGLAMGLRGSSLLVLALIALSKAAESYGQTLYGYQQLRSRLDLVGRSLLLRALLGAGAFTASYVTTESLPFACAGLALAWIAVLYAWDIPTARRLANDDEASGVGLPGHGVRRPKIKTLLRRTAPLGLAAGLSSATINAPRYVIQVSLGSTALGLFAPLAYLAQSLNILTGTLSDTVISHMARAFAAADRHRLLHLLGLLVGLGLSLTFVAAGLAWFGGGFFLDFILGPEYVNQTLLMMLILAAGLATLQRTVARGLQASQSFASLAKIEGLTLVVVLSSALLLVPNQGLLGAASATSIGMTVGVVATGAVFLRTLHRMPPQGSP